MSTNATIQTRYLRRIGHSWYVRVKVPRRLQDVVGNTHIVKALHTRDLDEANRRKWRVVELIKAELSRLKGQDSLTHYAELWRKDIQKALDKDDLLQVNVMKLRIADEAEEIFNETGDGKKATAYYQLATTTEKTLDELIDEWLLTSDYLIQTQKQHKNAYTEMKQHIGGNTLPIKVTDENAIDFVETFVKQSGKSYATQRRLLNSLVAFWDWLGLKKHVPRHANIWKGFKLSKQRTQKKTEDKRPYTDDELIKLLSDSPVYDGLKDVIVLGMYTGARLDEICSLKQGDVRKNGDGIFFVSIRKSKTKAGVRTIAIAHPCPSSILERRKHEDGDSDGQLFPEFRPGGYDGKLSWAVSKAFGRHRDKMELSRATDFHSFRRTLITLMENLGLDQVKIARYVGHELPTIAFTVYSGGSSDQTNIEVAKRIQYPENVERAIGQSLRLI